MKKTILLIIIALIIPYAYSFPSIYRNIDPGYTTDFIEEFNFFGFYDTNGWKYTESCTGDAYPNPEGIGFYFPYNNNLATCNHQINTTNTQINMSDSKFFIVLQYVKQTDGFYYDAECSFKDPLGNSWLNVKISKTDSNNLTVSCTGCNPSGTANKLDYEVSSASFSKQEILIDFDPIQDRYYLYHNGQYLGFNNFSLNPTYLSTEIVCDSDIQNENSYTLHEIGVYSGIVGSEIPPECNFPLLFCDQFNYNSSMQGRQIGGTQWNIYKSDNSLNNTFTPNNNELKLDQNESYLKVSHEKPLIDTAFRPDLATHVLITQFSPVLSIDFKLNMSNITSNIFELTATDDLNKQAFDIKILNNGDGHVNITYLDNESNDIVLCSDCDIYTNDGKYTDIKIISYFAQREVFPFNSTVSADKIEFYADGHLLGTIDQYIDGSSTETLRYINIIKDDDASFIMDNYKLYVGTDHLENTMPLYYNDYYDNTTLTSDLFREGTGELSDAVTSLWDDFGLRTTSSKIMAGLFLMFMLAIFMYGAGLSAGFSVSPLVLGITELFFMILLVYIKLLPIWIPFVVVLMSVGIGALIFKNNAT